MHQIIIKPKQRWKLLDPEELWRYRELFYIFAWRDIKVRYKQTFLGVAWVIFQPLISTSIFTIFFGRLAKLPSENLPYQLFVYIGLVFWTFFSTALSQASNSMIENTNIIKKIYFPKEILPISAVFTNLVDFFINFVLILLMTFYFGYKPTPQIIFLLPISLLIISITAAGLGFFLSSLNVKYRDVRYILPFFIQLMLFLTPVIYPSSVIRDSFRWIMVLNPMTGVIETMRSCFSGVNIQSFDIITYSGISSIVIFILGLSYFKHTEKFFADES